MIDDKLLDKIEATSKKARQAMCGDWTVDGKTKLEGLDPPTALSLVAEIRELRAQNAALFKIAAAGRDYHEKPLADEVLG